MDLSDPVVVAFIGLAVAVVTGAASVLAIVLNTRSARAARKEEIEAARIETIRKEAREDALAARQLAAADAARIEAALARTDIRQIGTQIDGLLAQKTISDKKEGAREATIISDEKARTLAQGQQQGREIERESVAASVQASGQLIATASPSPVPVIDDTVATAIEKVGDALENSAKATQHVADATIKSTEEKK